MRYCLSRSAAGELMRFSPEQRSALCERLRHFADVAQPRPVPSCVSLRFGPWLLTLRVGATDEPVTLLSVSGAAQPS